MISSLGGVGGNVVVAIVAVVLGAPFLNFLLSLTRAKVDRNNVIVTGAGSTVTAMGQAVEGLRRELDEVWADLREARAELDATKRQHKDEMDRLRSEHRQEIATMNAAHRAQMVELRAQRDETAAMNKRLMGQLGERPAREEEE